MRPRIVRRIWSESEPFDHEGRFYKLKGVLAKPKPYWGSRPVLVSAGKHKVTVSKVGFTSATKVVEIASAESVKVALDPIEQPKGGPPIEPPKQVEQPVTPPPAQPGEAG